MTRFVKAKDLQKVGRVARLFALNDVCLASLKASRPIPLAEAPNKPLHVKVKDSAKSVLSDDGRALRVKVLFEVSAQYFEADTSGDETSHAIEVLSVAGTFDLDFEKNPIDELPSKDEIQIFGRVNGVYNAWPYVREIVSSCVSRFGYPPLTLGPLIVSPEPAPGSKKTTEGKSD